MMTIPELDILKPLAVDIGVGEIPIILSDEMLLEQTVAHYQQRMLQLSAESINSGSCQLHTCHPTAGGRELAEKPRELNFISCNDV